MYLVAYLNYKCYPDAVYKIKSNIKEVLLHIESYVDLKHSQAEAVKNISGFPGYSLKTCIASIIIKVVWENFKTPLDKKIHIHALTQPTYKRFCQNKKSSI